MFSRRELIRAMGALPFVPGLHAQPGSLDLRHRVLGKTGRWVVPLGLGGQASIQWTPEGTDAADIIVRAVELGVNYLDTANAYGPSQANYGEAFRRLHLAPHETGYKPALREQLYLASKTVQRLAANPERPGAGAVTDLKRTLTTIFGDGKGFIPEGAYLDAMQMHNLQRAADIDLLYEGFAARGGKMPERVGALAAMLDFRDGTNYTGHNPEHRRWIRHVGITGHLSSPTLMYALQRDELNIIDTLLVGVNANDRRYGSHQYNVLPLARARGLGVIAMKVFADGVFYGKEPRFSRTPADVIRSVGRPGAVPPADFIRYPLSLPGVTCAIIGTGRINREKAAEDQLVANLTAALGSDIASPIEMKRIEDEVAAAHGTNTNYFNERREGIVQPTEVKAEKDGDRVVVQWNNALAASEPILSYNIYAGDRLLLSMPYRPQMTLKPFSAFVPASDVGAAPIRVVASEKPPMQVGAPLIG